MYTTTLALLTPDLTLAQAFLNALDSSPDARFGFRTFDDKGDDPRLAVKAYGTLDRGARQSSNPTKNGQPCRPTRLLSYMQGKGAGAFVVPNELDGQGQRKGNVVAVRTFYIDADSRPQVEAAHAFIARTGLVPTIEVASGGIHQNIEKRQIYWRVAGCPVDEFTRAQLTLVSRTGSDPAVQDASRVMRLPGFWHQKGEPRMSRILSLSPEIDYGMGNFLARVQAQSQVCDPWAGGRGRGAGVQRGLVGDIDRAGPTARLRVLLAQHGGLVTPAVRNLLREAKAPTDEGAGNRHSTLLAVAARCVHLGWPDADIHALVQPVLIECWGGDREDRLTTMLAWVREKEAAALAFKPAPTASASALARAFGSGRVAT